MTDESTEKNLRRRRRPASVLVAGSLFVGAAVSGVLLTGRASSSAPDAVLTASTTAGPTGAASGSRVTVTGTGTATGAPDTLTLQMGATTTAPSATAALDQNSTEIAALSAVFLKHGVTRSDVQTSGLSVSPAYGSNGNVTGYQASDQLTVTMHRLSSAGGVIDAAAHAVGNDVQIDGIAFSIADTSSLLRSARIDAVRNAQAEAEAFASAAGASLGPVLSISDQTQQPLPIVGYSLGAAASALPVRSVPIHAGTQQISVQVQVVYALRG